MTATPSIFDCPSAPPSVVAATPTRMRIIDCSPRPCLCACVCVCVFICVCGSALPVCLCLFWLQLLPLRRLLGAALPLRQHRQWRPCEHDHFVTVARHPPQASLSQTQTADLLARCRKVAMAAAGHSGMPEPRSFPNANRSALCLSAPLCLCLRRSLAGPIYPECINLRVPVAALASYTRCRV